MIKSKKQVVVLAHADGWGAVSADKVLKHLHKHYPDIAITLIVSRATKDKSGGILTKLDALKPMRELKETKLKEYFDRVDAIYATVPDAKPHTPDSCFTFNKLAELYCEDKTVHYTTKGGPDGGLEVADLFRKLDLNPEIVLSVDTMAILPEEITSRYHCFSTHPAPLDTVKIEGMQGTLRALVNQVVYDNDGNELPTNQHAIMGAAYVKGTLFLQHPELDKGPLIKTVKAAVCPGMSAYQVRDEVYHVLTDEMLDQLPTLLVKNERSQLVEKAAEEKKALDSKPHRKIPALREDQLAQWQSQVIAFSNTPSAGLSVVQNEMVNPFYFRRQMRRFFPGNDAEFDAVFDETFSPTLDKIARQKDNILPESWARCRLENADQAVGR